MSVTATVVVGPEALALEETLTAHPELRVELERVVPLGDRAVPQLRVSGPDPKVAEEALRADGDVSKVEVIDRRGESLLSRVEWEQPDGRLLRTLVATGATCLEAVGTPEGWHLTLRFPAHERLATCYRRCTADGTEMIVGSIRRSDRPDSDYLASVLTRPQQETLEAALEAGYFAVPRDTTLRELADQLGVSDTAASQRLRRGLRTLLGECLTTDTGPLVTAGGR